MLEAIREAIWSEIEAELRSEDLDLIDDEDGLSYELNEVSQIHVGAHGVNGRIWFGVSCSKKDHKHKYDKIKKSLESFLEPIRKLGHTFDELKNDKHRSDMNECFVMSTLFLPSNQQPPEPIMPRMGSFDHPSPRRMLL